MFNGQKCTLLVTLVVLVVAANIIHGQEIPSVASAAAANPRNQFGRGAAGRETTAGFLRGTGGLGEGVVPRTLEESNLDFAREIGELT